MNLRRSINTAVATATLVLASCAPFATYPPVEGSLGIDNPNLEPVPSIMADAIWYVHERYGGERETFAINLPPGTPSKVYDKVLEIIPNATPMTDPGEWAYHITQIRARGLNAEADVVFPRADAPAGLITLQMRKGFKEFDVTSAKVWNFPADVPPPHWRPAVDDSQERMAGDTDE